MNATAYLVGVIATDETPPRYLGCDIFSEATPSFGGNRFPFTIARADGANFGEAVQLLREQIANGPWLTWAKPLDRASL